MPPCLDVYVWVPRRPPGTLQAFVDRYVDSAVLDDERLAAFTRTYITKTPTDLDASTLAELRSDTASAAFTLYLRGREHDYAMITVTEDGATVLGLSLDDPDASPLVREQGGELMDRLRAEFSSPAGIAGTELPPPRSRRHWQDIEAELRTGAPDPA